MAYRCADSSCPGRAMTPLGPAGPACPEGKVGPEGSRLLSTQAAPACSQGLQPPRPGLGLGASLRSSKFSATLGLLLWE